MSAITSSIAGIQLANANFVRASYAVNKSLNGDGRNNQDPASALVDLKKAEFAIKANAAVFRSVSDTQKSLLDILV